MRRVSGKCENMRGKAGICDGAESCRNMGQNADRMIFRSPEKKCGRFRMIMEKIYVEIGRKNAEKKRLCRDVREIAGKCGPRNPPPSPGLKERKKNLLVFICPNTTPGTSLFCPHDGIV